MKKNIIRIKCIFLGLMVFGALIVGGCAHNIELSKSKDSYWHAIVTASGAKAIYHCAKEQNQWTCRRATIE